MTKSGSQKVIIVALVTFLGISLLLLGRAYWQIYGFYGYGGYRGEIRGLSGLVATEQALDDFRHGKLRLLKLNGENDKLKFSGQHEGPFEIWYPQYLPILGVGHQYATKQYIEFYNRKMEYMHKYPNTFLRKTQADANQ
jgi:hypothetical protein